MVFQSNKDLFHDIPAGKAVYSSRSYPKNEESFVKFYYEEALPDADAAAENKIDYSIQDRAERQKYCRDYFPGCLRVKIDKWLDKKAPIVALPKAGSDKIMIGLDLEEFNIFESGYMASLKEDMNSGLGMLRLYRDRHRGVFKRSQKSILKSVNILLLFIALIVFDLPYMLVRFLDAVWEMMMPVLSLSPDSRIFETPLEAVYVPLVFVMLIYGIFSAWMTITRLNGLPASQINIGTLLGGIFLSPVYLLMRFMVSADFFQAVKEIWSVAAANIDKGIFMLVISVLDIIVNQFFVMIALMICYLGSVIYAMSVYLFRSIFKRKKEEEIEEREVVGDIKSQWDFYVRFRKELRNADRQLKFMDMWNQSARGKGHFPGWFDINDYVRRAENALLVENRAKLHDLEKEELKNIQGQDSIRKSLMDKVQELKKQERELADKSQVTDMDERNKAMVRFAVSMKGRENMDLNTMYDDLAVVLGYKNLWSARRYPEKWQGEKEYSMGFHKEKAGQSCEEVKELYEKGQG